MNTPRRENALFCWTGVLLLPALALLLSACGGGRGEKPDEAPKPDANALKVLFLYGSEKEEWIKDVTAAFNAEKVKSSSGKPIYVEAVPMGSGETVDEVLSGQRQAHLISPASAAYIEVANYRARQKENKELVGPTKNLVLSPVVVAMWKSMADALRKDKKDVGWAEILELARNPKGWAAVGQPQWGEFRFAHTHPEYSNSGLISLLAIAYAATGKKSGLTLDDVKEPKVAKYLEDIEKAVVHYGSSTGFFGKKMIANGKQYLSAGVLYENLVIESYAQKLPDPMVAIYPREGTFWSDHPAGVVQRNWVTDEHRKAAEAYIDYLLKKPQQVKALKYGFRPGDENVPLDAPLDAAHGIDPNEPKRILQVPAAEVMDALLQLWRKHKKPSRIVLVIDTSGSMRAEQKMVNAQLSAQEMIGLFTERDEVSLLAFSDKPVWVKQDPVRLNEAGKTTMKDAIAGLFPRGETALYDATDLAYQYLQERPRPEAISAVVVLTDGEDNKSSLKLDRLLEKIAVDYEKKNTRVFTIAYGSDARPDVLEKIANVTQARSYKGDPKTILKVLKDIATFF
jgi:Ca-activated chloride channel family protein